MKFFILCLLAFTVVSSTLAAPKLDGPVNVIARTPEGQILVAGMYQDGSLYQLNADGLIRTDFSPFSSDASISAIHIQSDQKILLSGYFGSPPKELHCEGLRRIDINGNNDNNFCSMLGKGFDGKVESILIQPDQRLIVAGGFNTLRDAEANGLARLAPNLELDSSFQHNVAQAFPPKTVIKSLALQPDGKILILGYFQKFFGKPSEGMGRLNSDGTEDTNFSLAISTTFFVGFTPLMDDSMAGRDLFLTQVLVQPDGNILVAGELIVHDEASRVYKVRLIRLSSNGSLDIGFVKKINEIRFDADINTLAVLPDGKILVGCNKPFVCLNPDGSVNDEAFRVARNSFLGGISSMLPLPDGKLLVGGYFNQYRGVRVPNLVRLNPDGTLDETFLVDSEP